MKKFLVLVSVCLVSACACMEDSTILDEKEVVYQNVQVRPQNCDYFDGKTCYRYVRRVRQQPVIRYHEPVVAKKTCNRCNKCEVASQAPAVNTCGATQVANSCEEKVRETREPVEVVYKKTTYKTVYEPQTTTSVTYERVPYESYKEEKEVETKVSMEPIEIVAPAQAPAQVEVITPLTTEEEILLNVK
ncbi:MAG: hypothetical protein IJV97_03750 [Alphaproteobacteria bacterium]|nr:hypothetical protein [Alphaproteobacteria bacterium]